MNIQLLMIIITVAGILMSFAVIPSIFLGKKIEDSAGRQKLSLFGKLELEANTLVMLLTLGILQTLAPIGIMVWKPELFRPPPATATPLTLNNDLYQLRTTRAVVAARRSATARGRFLAGLALRRGCCASSLG